MRLLANPATGIETITLAIFHALKGQRNVEDLLRAIPDTRLIPGDVRSGGSARVASTLLGLLVIVAAGIARNDLPRKFQFVDVHATLTGIDGEGRTVSRVTARFRRL